MFARDLTGGVELSDARSITVGIAVIRKCDGNAHARDVQIDLHQYTGNGAGQATTLRTTSPHAARVVTRCSSSVRMSGASSP